MKSRKIHAVPEEFIRSSNMVAPEMSAIPRIAIVSSDAASVSDISGLLADADRDRVRRCLAGERGAFDELVVRHESSVFHLAWRILRRREDAEDAAQETFVRAWRSLGRFDQKKDFRPWLLKIAVNTALSHTARRRPEAMNMGEKALGDLVEPSLHSPSEVASRREMIEAAARLADQLPPEQSALFQLRYGEELSCKEIAPIIGKRPGAVAVALHRLRERMRRALFEFKEGRDPS